jgi:hypothetical protein
MGLMIEGKGKGLEVKTVSIKNNKCKELSHLWDEFGCLEELHGSLNFEIQSISMNMQQQRIQT